MNTQSILQPTRFSIAMLIVLELALTAAAAFTLFQLAEPMARPALALGLGQRYAVAEKEAKVALSDVDKLDDPLLLHTLQATLEPKHQRAQNLNRQSGLLLAGNALLGWLALWIARRQRPGATLICISLWFGGAMAFNPFGLLAWEYWTISALFAAFYFFYGIIYRCRNGGQARTATGVFNSYWSAAGWPGWVLFTGIGVLFVTDFAARGPISQVMPYAGVAQLDALWLANMLLNLSAIWRDRLMIGLAVGITRLSQLWLRPRGPLVLLTLAIPIAVSVGWLGRPDGYHGLDKPQLSSELFRAVFGIAAAWALYRVGEWRADKRRIWAEIKHMLILLVLIGIGLLIARDGGPALIMSLAVCLSWATPLLHRLIVRHARLGLLGIVFAVLVGGSIWSFGVHQILPKISSRAAEREVDLLDGGYHAASAYLAQIHWMIDAAPTGGFGLGRVPWCGAKALVGARTCTKGSGAPLQMPSDYAAAGLAVVCGVPGAALIILTLLGWLAGLSWSGLAAWRTGRTPTWNLLQIELVATFTLLAFAQTLITFACSFGLLPITGITLPCLGYGSAALICTSIWIGLALNPAGTLVRPHH